ncbi:MAG: pyridine nucleotide-disulfide oxidoreductase [Deltaproteobacteria bacterium CG03_land_8_20_14_0_80_45_14]|nr:MAG: pyridine nucleotide-disulfide oxidoreductase [Deltaproteobacteria bacterium CG03_land_8_20_14_0_80_45_14]
MKYSDVDVAVIGSGPAGMAAAIKAKEEGAEHVLILERQEQLGGLLHQCVHNGFGLLYFGQDLTGPEYAHRFVEKVRDLGIEVLLETMVIRISGDRKLTAANSREGTIFLRPKSIVLAMGCRERSRGQLSIPGTRPAGIFTAGTAQRLVNVEGFIPGRKVVILGSGDIGMIMARRLTLEGVEVKAVVEILPYIGGLIRNEVQCLYDFHIPILLEHTVIQIHGEQRVKAVTIAKVDKNKRPVDGTEQNIECDTLLLSVGLIPENELSRMAGVDLDPLAGGPVVDERRETSIPGIFAGGNVVHVHDLVDDVSWEAEIAGAWAAKLAQKGDLGKKGKIILRPGRNIRSIVPQTISGQNDVTLYIRIKEMEEKVQLRIGAIYNQAFRVVKPSEIIKVNLLQKELNSLRGKTTELIAECEPFDLPA